MGFVFSDEYQIPASVEMPLDIQLKDRTWSGAVEVAAWRRHGDLVPPGSWIRQRYKISDTEKRKA